MKAVGQLTGGVAHDFNNLLGVIVANLDFLAEETDGDDNARQLIDAAINAAENGARLNRQLLAFSRQQTLQMEKTSLNELVAGTTDLLRRTLGETVTTRTVLGAMHDFVEVDRAQLQTALLNLAVNARYAMPDGGHLTIETADAVLDESYAERDGEVVSGSYVMLAVTDTGTGIPKDVLDKVFDPFFTTKPVGEGSGLGLSMVHGFVKQSGGHIAIYSEEGEGTTVRLYFPQRKADGNVHLAQDADPDIPEGDGETILVVEDAADLRLSTVAALERLGYRVLDAGDADEAMGILSGDAKVDLLFTDIVLPHGMNGVELAARAQQRWAGLRAVYATGYAESAVLAGGRLDTNKDLLSKPYRRADLARHIRQALDRKTDPMTETTGSS
jgi:CheY-like chemotaxis protein/two-component sensor histidine kinase